jgi:AcrR family transcriptional regulator/chromosome segregation and condensation protein ScpB
MAAELSGETGMSGRGSPAGAMFAAGLQRGRLLSATLALVGERGYEGVTARSVSERAGVSNRAFYECFGDREDCFLAAFNHAVAGLELEARAAWESELGWTARVRSAVAALLRALDHEPAVRRLVFVDALAAGPRVLGCRARVLESLAAVVDGGRANAKAPRQLPPLVAEGVVGATFGVIHARLLELRPEPLVNLLGPLMATIVLPYRGSAAAARELECPTPRIPTREARTGEGLLVRPLGTAVPVDYRLTVRARIALAAVAGRPGMSNREVSEEIGLADQGQISRIMKRLVEQGLIENARTNSKRVARAWRLTADGEAVVDTGRDSAAPGEARREVGRGGQPSARSTRRGKSRQLALTDTGVTGTGFRLTALTYDVLSAVASSNGGNGNPSNREIAQVAGVKDEGQMLARLQTHGLLQNTGGVGQGAPNAWQLTHEGEGILSLSQSRGALPSVSEEEIAHERS